VLTRRSGKYRLCAPVPSSNGASLIAVSARARSTPFRARPYDYGEARRIADELGLAEPVAIALVRRGYNTVEAARRFLAAAEDHEPELLDGIGAALERIEAALEAGQRITVHGDYDVDGISATAIMVAALRRAGAECDWLIPDRLGDGYGIGPDTLERLRERGTGLLVTVDCGIGSAAEVAAIETAGIAVVVSDHHQPGEELPGCPVVHPLVGGYPFDALCGAAVAAKLAQALERKRGGDPDAPIPDLDLVALATVADLVPLVGENRSLVRRGLESIRRSPRPGLLALMAAARVEPERVDEGDIAFRLGPRLNAAGRLYRADAGVELMLTGDDARAAAIAAELDAANRERRETERLVTTEAEAALRELADADRAAPAIVLAGAGWHPGVVGIVASRLVERHQVPAIVLSIDAGRAKGSGRSVEGFDLLAALDACAPHLDRYGGHRAAAGLELEADAIDGFRAAFIAHAETVEPVDEPAEAELVDAFVGAEALGLDVAEQLASLAPFGCGNPGVRLLVPGARVGDVRPMGEEGRHARFSLSNGSLSARGVAFNANGMLTAAEREPHDLAVRLEVNHWNGAVEPRAVLADAFARGAAPEDGSPHGHRCRDGAGELWWSRFDAGLDRDPGAGPLAGAHGRDGSEPRRLLDARRGSAAARIAELLSSGERVMVVAADAGRRSALASPGTIAGAGEPACVCLRCPDDELTRLASEPDCDLLVTDWGALVAATHAAAGFRHLVLVDPPNHPDQERSVLTATGAGFAHACWGSTAELAELCWDGEWDLRGALADIYRALTPGELAEEELRTALIGGARYGRTPEAAARAVRVLRELGIVNGRDDGDARSLRVVSSERTKLELSEAYRAYAAIHQEGRKYLQSRRAEP
jgi:single-stranded-DNA-specific exonuclease